MLNQRMTLPCVLVALTFLSLGVSRSAAAGSGVVPDLWSLSREASGNHRFSTLFTAQDVRRHLSTADGLGTALDWCKRTGVTKVYLETFRDSYQAERETLEQAKAYFLKAGLLVSGCVTPTKVGKPSTGWKELISCYTDRDAQNRIQAIFEYSAALFDEIMIDDFWFTDCACGDCDAARQGKAVTIGEHVYPVSRDAWDDYRCELMVRVSRDRVLAPSRRVNPEVKLIIKYPQWYDNFHMRGYEVVRQSADFDRIWVGTETRDYDDNRWGGTPQYEGYFIMRWLGEIGGEKCGGGWFDPFGTTEATYVEQARQTVLAGARESLLFAYGALQRETGPKNVEALRSNIPELLRVAAQVRAREIVGVAAYKPPGSHPGKESRVFDFVGMLGIPLVPTHEFPTNALTAFFSVHALKDPDFLPKLRRFVAAGKPVLLTDGLAAEIKDRFDVSSCWVLPVSQDPKRLLQMDREQLAPIRAALLAPLKVTFDAPNRVALYLFRDGSHVIENFNATEVEAHLNGKSITAAPRGWVYQWEKE